jgi:ferric-dicitrate binding protein FerR (iron transport regulator)
MDDGVRRAERKNSGARIRDSALPLACEEAAYWFVRCTDETLNLENRSELLRWLRRSPENVAELVRIGVYGRKLRKVDLAS